LETKPEFISGLLLKRQAPVPEPSENLARGLTLEFCSALLVAMLARFVESVLLALATLEACLPRAVRVDFGKCAIVRFLFAAAPTFLISPQNSKTGLVGPVQERRLDAVTSQRGAYWRQGAAGRVVASFGFPNCACLASVKSYGRGSNTVSNARTVPSRNHPLREGWFRKLMKIM
jgi:hypothetical protein